MSCRRACCKKHHDGIIDLILDNLPHFPDKLEIIPIKPRGLVNSTCPYRLLHLLSRRGFFQKKWLYFCDFQMIVHRKFEHWDLFLSKALCKEVSDFRFEVWDSLYVSSVDVCLDDLIFLSFEECRNMEKFCIMVFHFEAIWSCSLSPNSLSSYEPLVKEAICRIQPGHLHVIEIPVVALSFESVYNCFELGNFIIHVVKIFLFPCFQGGL